MVARNYGSVSKSAKAHCLRPNRTRTRPSADQALSTYQRNGIMDLVPTDEGVLDVVPRQETVKGRTRRTLTHFGKV